MPAIPVGGYATAHPSLAVVSTYPPTACGIATFSAALVDALVRSRPTARVGVVQLTDVPPRLTRTEVLHQLVAGDRGSLREAIRVLDQMDVALLQHEYGIYGGEEGRELLDLLAGLSTPLIAVLHTVRVTPSALQRTILEALLEAAERVVVMTETAAARLVDTYRVDPQRVQVIPHGARLNLAPPRPRRDDRPVVLSWGLLGPGKGIEWVIDALADLTDLDPAPRYVIAGRTHPKVQAKEGESYREGLITRAVERGVAHMVEFDDRYQESADLLERIRAADVVVLPYDSTEQAVSGVLTDAVASGRPVIATAFPHAAELAKTGAVTSVAHRDPAAIATALRAVLTDPATAQRMADAATELARSLSWDSVAARYWGLVREVRAARERVVA